MSGSTVRPQFPIGGYSPLAFLQEPAKFPVPTVKSGLKEGGTANQAIIGMVARVNLPRKAKTVFGFYFTAGLRLYAMFTNHAPISIIGVFITPGKVEHAADPG